MKIKNHSLNEHGIAHLGLILLLLVIIGGGYVVYNRVHAANDKKADTSTSASADSGSNQDAKDAADINDADSAAQDVKTTNTQEAPNVAQ